MGILPTSRTVPQAKDLAVNSALGLRVGSSSREDLDSVLGKIDSALDAEALTRISGDNTISADLSAHLNDTVDAHDASAISFVPVASIAAINVQSAITELESEVYTAIGNEATSRTNADNALGARIDVEIEQLKLVATGTNALVTIGSSIATRIDNTQLRVPGGSLVSDFIGATVNFSTGAVTGQVSAFTRIDFAGQGSKFAKYSIVLLPTQPDSILIIPGVNFYASLAAAQADTSDPAIAGGVPVGIIIVQDTGSAGIGTIQNIAQANVQQFKAGAGGGSGSGGSGSVLDPDQESTYAFYARSDFSVDQKLFFGSVSGAGVTDQVLGLGRIKSTAGTAIFTSNNLVGNQLKYEGLRINQASIRLLYEAGYTEPAVSTLLANYPIIQVSRDGGTTYANVTESSISAKGNMVIADYAFPTDDILTHGTLAGAAASINGLAAIITPSYDQIISSFDFYLGTAAIAGSVIAELYNVSAGIPTTLIATCPQSMVLGSDIVLTRAYKNFTIPSSTSVTIPNSVTLLAGSSYAIVVRTTSGANLVTETTTGSTNSASGATWNGSIWSSNANKYAVKLYSSGVDMRVKVQSSGVYTGNTAAESHLKGFGVDFVWQGNYPVTGDAKSETRVITSTEASSGTITLQGVTFTPGMKQLTIFSNGHSFMTPQFTELSSNQVQFPANSFVTGDIVTFVANFGIVDGSSVALGKFNLAYDAIVGSAGQVSSGYATYSSLQSAITAMAAAGAGKKILVLAGTYTENITINSEINIEGHGRSSVISGTWTMQSASDFSIIENLKITGAITFNAGADSIFFQRVYSTSTLTNSGSANAILVIVE